MTLELRVYDLYDILNQNYDDIVLESIRKFYHRVHFRGATDSGVKLISNIRAKKENQITQIKDWICVEPGS